MTDLGFGLVDKRTVLVILFVIALSSGLLHNQLPIDTTSVTLIFSSLVVLTGFIYICRSITRLLIVSLFMMFNGIISRDHQHPGHREFREIVSDTILVLMMDWTWNKLSFHRYSFGEGNVTENITRESSKELGIIGVIDRLFLVVIAYATTLMALRDFVSVIGIIGIGVIIIVYVSTGMFTFLIKDAMAEADEKHEQLLSVASRADTDF
jgi:hypothetical protein